jgi:hypothetical protein
VQAAWASVFATSTAAPGGYGVTPFASPPEVRMTAGDRLGPDEVLGLVGSGDTGEVYRARISATSGSRVVNQATAVPQSGRAIRQKEKK